MPSQTRPWQQTIIEAATKQNDLSSLFWAIEWERDGVYQIALLGGRLPVVPLAPDVTDATDAAQVLMFSLQAGKLGKWALWLTHRDILDGLGREWFVWGEAKEEPMKPKRIQRKRVKGWKKPVGVVNVTRPGKWGNPFKVMPVRRGLVVSWIVISPDTYVDAIFGTEAEAASMAIDLFSDLIEKELDANPGALDELRGKDLMCFCAEGAPCHADVLLRFCAMLDGSEQ